MTRNELVDSADPRVALVIGWGDAITAQIDVIADFPQGTELEGIRECDRRGVPGRSRSPRIPGIRHVRVRPHWVRYSEFTQAPPRIVELADRRWPTAGIGVAARA